MEPAGKLKVIGVLAVVAVLLIIGRSKEDASFVTEPQPSPATELQCARISRRYEAQFRHGQRMADPLGAVGV